MLGASPALASTQAGSTITNNVTVNYQVGGFSQTAATASDTLTVDRKVALTVAEVGTSTTTVSPGQTAAVTTFTVTNNSNATLDFALTGAQLATGATGAHSNTDSFDATNLKIYVDSDSSGTFNSGDQEVSYLDELAGDGGSKTVFVVVNIPTGLSTGAVAGVTLQATSQSGGTSGSQGTDLVATSGANTAGMDTVFADAIGAATGDGARDGKHSAMDDYTVLAAALSVVKSSKIISDPVNGTTNPKFIPGATIEYCIAVSNAAGSATATGINISDSVPLEVTYLSAYGIFVNGTVDGSGQCVADGSAGGSFGSGIVAGTLTDLSAGTTRTLRFRATIN
jgi:uncharacterized repeat protein (TIGR01451 family)